MPFLHQRLQERELQLFFRHDGTRTATRADPVISPPPLGCGTPKRRSADKQARQDVHDAREGPPAGRRHGQSHRRVQEGGGVSIVQRGLTEADKWTSDLAPVQ